MSGSAELLWRYFAHESEEDTDPWMVYSGACDMRRRQYRIQYGTDVIDAEFGIDDTDWMIHGLVFIQKAKAIASAVGNTTQTFIGAIEILLQEDPWLSSVPTLENVD